MSMFPSLDLTDSGSVPEHSHDVKIGVDLSTTYFTAYIWDDKTFVNPESAYEILPTDSGKRSFP